MLARVATLAGLLLAGVGPSHAQPLNYQDLWWAGSQENGWGLSISQQGNTLFSVMYIYDAAGKPQWVVMPGGTWNAGNTAYSGALYIPSGSSFANYEPARFVVGAPVGDATLDFAGGNGATLRYTIGGVSGSKSITRQVFGAGAAIGNYTDLWWGGQGQNGWGVSLTQQGATLFAVWYTYDAQGKPTWLVMPSGRFTSSNTVSGTLYRTSASPWVGAPYDPSRLQVSPVGSLTFTFTDSNTATMRYGVDGADATVAIGRQVYGNAAPPAMSSFAKLHERVVAPACLSCHTAGHPYATQSGLVLDAPVAYRNLMNGTVKDGGAIAQGISKLIAPRDVNGSFFHRKLLLWDPNQPASMGAAMPLGNTSLSVGQLEFIKQWIEAGAPEAGEVADAKQLNDTALPVYAPFAPLLPPPAGKGLQVKVESFQVQPHFERELFIYRSLDNPEPIYVTRMETRMRSNSHHLLLYDFQSGTPAGAIPPRNVIRDIRNPDGSLNFLNMLPMAYHVFFGGSMTPTGGYTFPPGVALRLPANAALDFNVHYVNTSATPIMGEAYANLYTVDSSQVQQVASTLNLPNFNLQLPPMQRTTQTKTFLFSTTTRVLVLTSHMHKLGERFVIRVSGGARDGELVYDNDDWEHPRVITYDSPIILLPGEGLTSIITYNNTTNRAISFGLTSEDEMGIIFGYTH
jgi:hypothetical protein